MADPLTLAGPAAVSAGSIIKVLQFGFAYNEVPDDVRAFQSSIETFSGTLSVAKKLRRVKSHLLDETDKQEIDRNIQKAVEILNDIGASIEACRKDLSTSGTVSVRNRVLWLLRDHRSFTSKTHTLDMCHQKLSYEIIGMRQLQDTPQAPAHDALDFGGSLRPPSRRRLTPVSGSDETARYQSQQNSPWNSPCLVSNVSLDRNSVSCMENSIHDPPPHRGSRRARYINDGPVTFDHTVDQVPPESKDRRYSDLELAPSHYTFIKTLASRPPRYSDTGSAVSDKNFNLKSLDSEQLRPGDNESPFADYRVGTPPGPRQLRDSGSISNISDYSIGTPRSENRRSRFSDSASATSDYTLVDTPPLTPSRTRDSDTPRFADDFAAASSSLPKRRPRKSLMIT